MSDTEWVGRVSFMKRTSRYTIDGKTYARVEEMPPEVRKKWEALSSCIESLSSKMADFGAADEKGQTSYRQEETVTYTDSGPDQSRGRSKIALFFWFALGGLGTVAIVLMLVIAVAMLVTTLQESVMAQLPLVVFLAGLVIPGFSFVNTANLFVRLKHSAPEVFDEETHGRGFIAHVGWCGRSMLTNLHASTVRIATDETGRVSMGLRRYAAAIRFLNWFGLAYLFLSLIGLGLYAGLGV